MQQMLLFIAETDRQNFKEEVYTQAIPEKHWAEEEARQKKQVVCLQILILKRKSKLMRTEQFWNNKFLILNKEKTNKNKKLQSWT